MKSAKEYSDAERCSICNQPWQFHYHPDLLKYKQGPHGTFGLIYDHTPHVPGIHAPKK